eukprot:9830956-Ditylum_brightwellii.AAC.2
MADHRAYGSPMGMMSQMSTMQQIINPVENTEKDPAYEPVDHPIQQTKEKEQGSTSNISTSLTKEVPEKKVDKDLGFCWKETLGNCTNEVLAKMLENTTQYFPTCVESETCAYPVQHHQKQLFPLHFLRLKGRTCADMFFSSIKGICRYTCIQLFVVLFMDFLWVKLLRQESQIPGVYNDFYREVGTPNELLTDNSKVQAGLKLLEIIVKI